MQVFRTTSFVSCRPLQVISLTDRYQSLLSTCTFSLPTAAFGFHAGFAGAALALEVWAWQLSHSEPFPGVKSYPNEDALIANVSRVLNEGAKNAEHMPRVIVIGALGRCGSGAVAAPESQKTRSSSGIWLRLLLAAPSSPLRTRLPGSPNKSTLNRCKPQTANSRWPATPPPIPPSFTPVPIYTVATTFDKPTVPVDGLKSDPALSVISIDHLPSLLPREASEAFSYMLLTSFPVYSSYFSDDLLPHLLTLNDRQNSSVWTRAEELFKEKVATLPASAPEN
ncbi:hypothetical protein B0T24DRAFT_588309 [Lasiosphaeria ovina]|uniref:Uncharacterized protein n=1 Tax=Lasiosphaeria ovina TaxID=92902 RepID=A0AAE0NLK3_9PEZI|nr:hypothetical protein B0T24DRAFT_588309 [Lasiosphaeria ovina]